MLEKLHEKYSVQECDATADAMKSKCRVPKPPFKKESRSISTSVLLLLLHFPNRAAGDFAGQETADKTKHREMLQNKFLSLQE
jgi:hypothetical protein